jgi:hypothetical protein
MCAFVEANTVTHSDRELVVGSVAYDCPEGTSRSPTENACHIFTRSINGSWSPRGVPT